MDQLKEYGMLIHSHWEDSIVLSALTHMSNSMENESPFSKVHQKKIRCQVAKDPPDLITTLALCSIHGDKTSHH